MWVGRRDGRNGLAEVEAGAAKCRPKPWGPGEGQQRAVKVRWRCDRLGVERLLDIARPLLRAGVLGMALGEET